MKLSNIDAKGWITIGIIVILIVFVFLYIKKKNTITTTTSAQVNPSASATAVVNATSPIKGDSFPLSYGARGANVAKWQTYLNSLGAKLVTDGIWGPKTEAASILYTKFNSITQDYFNSVIK